MVYFRLLRVSGAARGSSLVAVSGGYSLLQGRSFSLLWLFLLRGTGFSSCITRPPSSWGTGLVAPWHLESSQTRDQIRVSSICRQPPNHCTTREVQEGCTFRSHFSYFSSTTVFFFSFAAILKHVQGCLFCFKINVVLYNKKDVFFHPRMKDFCHRPRAPAVTITAGQTGALF